MHTSIHKYETNSYKYTLEYPNTHIHIPQIRELLHNVTAMNVAFFVCIIFSVTN